MAVRITDLPVGTIITNPDILPFVTVADDGGLGLSKKSTFSTLSDYVSSNFVNNSITFGQPTVYPQDLSTGGPWWLSNGNVGINTITPNEALSVNGSISATGTIWGNTFIGATASTAGSTGTVPIPLAHQQTNILTGNSVWTPLSAISIFNYSAPVVYRGTTASFTPSYTGNYLVSVHGTCQIPYIYGGLRHTLTEAGMLRVYMTDTVSILSDALAIRLYIPAVITRTSNSAGFRMLWFGQLIQNTVYNFGIKVVNLTIDANTDVSAQLLRQGTAEYNPFWVIQGSN